jgi:LacI family transcriptional regulator
MEGTPRITIRELADLAGVSTATVSRAMNNDRRTAEKTRIRIRGLAEKYGYRPNPGMAAVASRRKRSHLQGLPVACLTQLQIPGNAYITQKIDAITPFAEQHGFRIHVHNLPMDVGKDQLEEELDLLARRGTAGIVFLQLLGDLRAFAEVDWSRFCVVSMERGLREPQFTSIRPCITDRVFLCWRKARELGFRRILMTYCDLLHGHPDMRDYQAALLWCQQQTPVKERIPMFTWGQDEEISERLGDCIRRYDVDVVLAFLPYLYNVMLNAGVQIPRDVGYISLHSRLPFTTGAKDNEMLLNAAVVQELEQMIRHGRQGVPDVAKDVQIYTQWQSGETI